MINKYINNLSLRLKLILFLIIPILTLLYFSSSNILLKLNEQREGEKSLEFIRLSFQIDDVLHELQKERGTSAGYIGSLGKNLHQELLAQRKLTDEKIKIFTENLSQLVIKRKYPELSRITSRAKLNQKVLATIRKDVETALTLDFFQRYSDLINFGISIIRQFQVVSSDVELSRQSDAYSNLLLLQERSGQERGLLNGVFAQGDLDATRFKLIAGYISDQDALLKEFYNTASKQHQALLSKKLENPVIEDVIDLRTAAIHKATRNDKLNSLQSLIGYGGLIHNFKNYLVRGEQIYVINFEKKYNQAMQTISEYESLPGMSEKEINSLEIIRSTFKKYHALLQRIYQLRAKGQVISQIDSSVKVNDAPALLAIEYLHKNITGLDTSEWWKKSTLRISFMREVSNKIRMDMLDYVRNNLSASTRLLYINVILTLLSLIMSFFLAFYFIRYLVGNIIKLETHMSMMRRKGEFKSTIKLKGNDELAKLAEEFNNLISERAKFEEQLLLAAAVFEKSSEAMVITDADNHFLMVNPAFNKITGYSYEEIKGKTPAILKSGKQDETFYQNMWLSLGKHGCWSGEIINKRKNGELYPEWLNINVIKNNKGETIRHIAMFSDISERKLNEEKQAYLQRQLLQSQKMESLGQLTGGIAHDFNNMLSAILGYAELAIEIDDKDEINSYLEEVLSAGNRAKELISRMLAFSRGGKEIDIQYIEIEPLLNESLKMIRPLIPSTIEFETYITDSNTPVNINPVMIHQVVMNLCINARDAITEHGKIIFTSKPVHREEGVCNSCQQQIRGDFIEVSVMDMGTGIEPENMNSLFEPFFSTKEMGTEKGTGMGLAMVHGIMHDHHGHILVESVMGKGSVFRLLFPVKMELSTDLPIDKQFSELQELSEMDLISIVKGRHILLIDDEVSVATMIQTVLESYDCKVTLFTDSQQALSEFASYKDDYDLVITDQTMPKLTGAELSKAVLEIRPDIPVIMCTGHSDNVNKKDAAEIGIKAYMPKPLRNKELLRTIALLLREKDRVAKL